MPAFLPQPRDGSTRTCDIHPLARGSGGVELADLKGCQTGPKEDVDGLPRLRPGWCYMYVRLIESVTGHIIAVAKREEDSASPLGKLMLSQACRG